MLKPPQPNQGMMIGGIGGGVKEDGGGKGEEERGIPKLAFAQDLLRLWITIQ
jgi:hypothetical protein